MSTGWLASHLGDVVVVQVGRSDSLYKSGHIPGARFLPLASVATTVAGVPNEFPAPAELAGTFRDLGIGDSGRIVLYGDDAGLYAARGWVAFDLLGHGARAAILDGGLIRWRAEGRELDTGLRPVVARPFTARWQADRVVDAAWVRGHLGDTTVVLEDARPAEQYGGAEPPCPADRPTCPQIPVERRGHLPGAKSLFWMSALVSREDPVLRPMHYLHEELYKPSGADQPGVRTIVTYCRTGMQASHAYFVARYIGYADVRLYDGSFLEWATLQPAARFPVERAAR